MYICPLTSLMMDQHSKFASRGLKTEFVGHKKTKMYQGKFCEEKCSKLVYSTPENLIQNVMYREMLLSQR